MRFLQKLGLITLLCLILLLQTGCWDQRLYEEIGFILQFGFETGPQNQLIMSVTVPSIEEEVDEKVEFMFESTEKLIRASREKLRNSSGKMLLGGKTQNIFFSKELAEKGVDEFLEIFMRNPENPLLANIIVVDGSPKEMMEAGIEYKDKPRLATYIAHLMRDAQRKYTAAETRIFSYKIQYYSKTIDTVAPLIRYDKEKIEIVGSALFRGDKMVGEINVDETLLLNALMQRKKIFEYIYKGDVPAQQKNAIKKGAALTITHLKRNIDVDIIGNIPFFKVNLDLKAMLDEYAGEHKLGNDEYKKELEKLIETALKDEILVLLKQLQKTGSDPIGFGEKLRATKNEYWKTVNWQEIYKEAEFDVTTKVNIEFYGALE